MALTVPCQTAFDELQLIPEANDADSDTWDADFVVEKLTAVMSEGPAIVLVAILSPSVSNQLAGSIAAMTGINRMETKPKQWKAAAGCACTDCVLPPAELKLVGHL